MLLVTSVVTENLFTKIKSNATNTLPNCFTSCQLLASKSSLRIYACVKDLWWFSFVEAILKQTYVKLQHNYSEQHSKSVRCQKHLLPKLLCLLLYLFIKTNDVWYVITMSSTNND